MASSYAHHFSERNIPFGVASSEQHPKPQAATRIQDQVIFLGTLAEAGFFKDVVDLPTEVLSQQTLNQFASLPKITHRAVRQTLQDAFNKDGLGAFPESAKADINRAVMHLPVAVGDFSGRSASPTPCCNTTFTPQTSPAPSSTSKTPEGSSSTTSVRRPHSSTSPLATKAGPAPSSSRALTSSGPSASFGTPRPRDPTPTRQRSPSSTGHRRRWTTSWSLLPSSESPCPCDRG